MSVKLSPNFNVRKLEPKDCEQYRDTLTECNFGAAKYLNEVMIIVDPESTYVAEEVETGQVLGFCAGYNLTDRLAFIGQYVVRPKYQGLGIGSKIWEQVIEHIGSDRNISLYSAEKMYTIYKTKWGFNIEPEKKLNFYYGKVDCSQLVKQIEGISLVDINEQNIKFIIEYDKQVCDGLDRSVFIKNFIKYPETVSLCAFQLDTNQVVGYCIITTTNLNTGSVEPLYADNQSIAELLISKCCESLPICLNNGLKYKCWDCNKNANEIALKIGLEFECKSPILFTKQIIDGNINKIYSVSNIGAYPF